MRTSNKWNKSEKIIWIKLLVFIDNQKKKKYLLNISIKSTIIEFVVWTMKTINKKGRV